MHSAITPSFRKHSWAPLRQLGEPEWGGRVARGMTGTWAGCDGGGMYEVQALCEEIQTVLISATMHCLLTKRTPCRHDAYLSIVLATPMVYSLLHYHGLSFEVQGLT